MTEPIVEQGQTTDTDEKPNETSPAPSFWAIQPIPGVIDAFLLGWKIVELRDRLRVAAALTRELQPPHPGETSPSHTDPAAIELGDSIWMTSIWHANFKQITITYAREFPNISTRQTLYEPPGGEWKNSMAYLYPYPSEDRAPDDYTAVGIIPDDTDGAKITQDFSIYDVTRRAINALAILYARSQDRLIQTTITAYQTALCTQMGQAGDFSEAMRRVAVDQLSTIVEELLDDWGSFLREQYYAGATSREGSTKLQAFEAGRNLARLTWSISAKTIGMEVSGEPDTAKVLAEWQKVFSSYKVVQAQHFIMALCGAMDDQYSQSPGKAASANATDADGTPYDPDLPSSMGTVISHCLDHWQAGVVWLGRPDHSWLPLDFYKHLRVALIEQSDVWQSLLTGRRRLGLFTVESVMSRLAQDALAGIEAEMGQDVEQNVVAEGKRDIGTWVRMLGPVAFFIAAAIIVAALLVGITIWYVVAHPNAANGNGAWAALGVTSLGAWAAALLGLRGTGSGTPSAASSPSAGSKSSASSPATIADRIGDAMNLIEGSVTNTFKAAYAQLRRELAVLNYAIGISYPLIESFVLHDNTDGGNKIQDDYSFMTTVIWTNDERREEVEDVVRVALGPIGLLSGVAVRKKAEEKKEAELKESEGAKAPSHTAHPVQRR